MSRRRKDIPDIASSMADIAHGAGMGAESIRRRAEAAEAGARAANESLDRVLSSAILYPSTVRKRTNVADPPQIEPGHRATGISWWTRRIARLFGR